MEQQVIEASDTTIEALYRRYYSAVLAYLYRMVGELATAEDLCQETFVKLLRKQDQQNDIININAWIYRVATNTAYDYLRRRRSIRFIPLLEDNQNTLSTTMLETSIHEQEPVQQALAQIPERYRQLLVLRDGEGHTTEELATAMGCTPNAVRLRLLRARAWFRQVYRAGEVAAYSS
jgi:RNA polymerase sigma-70 factor (ECF subfamily)